MHEHAGRRLRRCRKAVGMGGAELARRLEVSPNYLCDVESGRASPSLEWLHRAATVLRIRPALLDPRLSADGPDLPD